MRRDEFSIVADGARRLREAVNYEEERRRVLAEMAKRLEAPVGGESFWRRFWREIELRKAVRTELRRKFPPDALHFSTPSCPTRGAESAHDR